jgi:hypothetical protein
MLIYSMTGQSSISNKQCARITEEYILVTISVDIELALYRPCKAKPFSHGKSILVQIKFDRPPPLGRIAPSPRHATFVCVVNMAFL